MFEYEKKNLSETIRIFLEQASIPALDVKWNAIPFSGHWGISTSFFQTASSEAKQGKQVNIRERAQLIAQMVSDHLQDMAGFDRIEPVNGYLNIYFSNSVFARRTIQTILEHGTDYGHGEPKNQRVMVEFSQPNTHKAFHVGHLRTTVLGDTICNILDFAGYDVVRANYIGDIGLHVIKWLWNYEKYHHGEQPPQDMIRWLGELYVEANRRMEEEPAAEAEVRALFARWDKRDEVVVELWQRTREWSMAAFQQVYSLLDVHFDHFFYESEMEESGKLLVDHLIQQGLAQDLRPDGAVIIPLDEILGTKEKYRVLVILRSDGTSLYSTKDLPLAIKKFEDFNLSRSIYVIDVRQTLYMQQIFKTLELMGYEWASKCTHLAYELVNLPGNVTIASRDGAVVLLEDLISEATSRASDIVKVKNPDLTEAQQLAIARSVAIGAIKYSMVSRDNTSIVTFDWDAALDFNGQAAPYIQYAAVRASSILKKSNIQTLPDYSIPDELQPAEIALIEALTILPEEVQRAASELKPLYLTNAAFEVAQRFNEFYNHCPVLKADPEIQRFRLNLVAASRQVIQNSLAILGIQTPSVM